MDRCCLKDRGNWERCREMSKKTEFKAKTNTAMSSFKSRTVLFLRIE